MALEMTEGSIKLRLAQRTFFRRRYFVFQFISIRAASVGPTASLGSQCVCLRLNLAWTSRAKRSTASSDGARRAGRPRDHGRCVYHEIRAGGEACPLTTIWVERVTKALVSSMVTLPKVSSKDGCSSTAKARGSARSQNCDLAGTAEMSGSARSRRGQASGAQILDRRARKALRWRTFFRWK